MQTPEPTEPTSNEEPFPVQPVNVGKIQFSVLVRLFERLQNERKLDRRMKYIAAWFTVCIHLHEKFTVNYLQCWRERVGNDFYPVLRLILPQVGIVSAG